MSRISQEQLEMQLRVLGRSLAEDPKTELLIRTRSAAGEALVSRALLVRQRQRRRLLVGLPLLLLATLPIPALFLWADWTAVSSLFYDWLPASASSAVLTVYLWIKVCALVVVYALALAGGIWAASQAARAYESDEAEALGT